MPNLSCMIGVSMSESSECTTGGVHLCSPHNVEYLLHVHGHEPPTNIRPAHLKFKGHCMFFTLAHMYDWWGSLMLTPQCQAFTNIQCTCMFYK